MNSFTVLTVHVYRPVYVLVSGEKIRLTPSLDILSSSSEMSSTVLLIVQVALVVISVSTDILRV